MIKEQFNPYDLDHVAVLIHGTPEEYEKRFGYTVHTLPIHKNPNKGLLKISEEQKPQGEPQK